MATLPTGADKRPPSQTAGEFVHELRAYLNAIDEFDEAVARHLGINRTDLRCVDILERFGQLSAGDLASKSGLTTGAMTFALDRLERSGIVARVRDTEDRRRVFVQLSEGARQAAWKLHEPMVLEMRQAMAHFSPADMNVLLEFFRASRVIYERHRPNLTDHGDMSS